MGTSSLCRETRVLICDEITAQLDALAAQALWQALLQLARQRGMALIVISHDPALRRAICNREVVLPDQIVVAVSHGN